MKKIFVFLSIICFLVSCDIEKEIEIDSIQYVKIPYIRGYVSKEYGVRVKIDYTAPIKTERFSEKIVADVYLMSNGKKLLKLPYERGSFYSLIDSLDYESYSIMVEIDGNTYYSTEQVLPQQVKVDSITMDIDPEKRWGTLKYHFFNDEKSAGYYCNTRAFSAKDKFYNREIYEIEFASSSYKDYNKSITKGKTCLSSLINYSSLDSIFYVAELITVSPDLDRFMRSELDYKATVDDLFFDNVIPHYSNIIGGYGIFVAYTVTSMNGYTSKTSIPIAKE